MKKLLMLGILLLLTSCASNTTSSQVSPYSHVDTSSSGPVEQPMLGIPRL